MQLVNAGWPSLLILWAVTPWVIFHPPSKTPTERYLGFSESHNQIRLQYHSRLPTQTCKLSWPFLSEFANARSMHVLKTTQICVYSKKASPMLKPAIHRSDPVQMHSNRPHILHKITINLVTGTMPTTAFEALQRVHISETAA